MRTAGIIKIVVGCVVLVALAVICAGLFMGRSLWHGAGSQQAIESLPAAPGAPEKAPESGKPDGDKDKEKGGEQSAGSGGATVVGGARYASADVREIDIEWIAGSVTVTRAEGEEITVSEESQEALTQGQQMRCTLIGGKLRIQYCDDIKNVWKWFSLGNYHTPVKHLTLALPASLDGSLNWIWTETVSADVYMDAVGARDNEIVSVSGKLRVTGLDCHELGLSTTSGAIEVSACRADELDLETVSGRMEIDGAFGQIDAGGVSGSLDLRCTNVPREIEAKTVSGKVSVTLPENAEFTASLESVSGDLSSEFPCVMSKGSMVCGSGANRYEFESVSGNVKILKG